jgi:hypothetical protein
MFPDDARLAPSARPHRVVARATTTKPSGTHQLSAERDGGGLPVVAAGAGQRGTLYDSFELNAMVVRLNRVLIGDGGGGGREARRPRKAAGSWINAPKVLFRKIKCAVLGGGRRGDG